VDEEHVVDAVHAVLRERAELTQKGSADKPWRLRHYLEGTGTDSVETLVAQRLGLTRLGGAMQMQCLRTVFYELSGLGLIVPGEPTQAIDWNSQSGIFTFTKRGLDYYLEGTVPLEHEGALVTALRELRDRCTGAVADGQLVLLGEAHHCWRQGCYRAAMVLIGVANEENGIELLDLLDTYPNKAPTASTEWTRATNPGNAFSTRFEAGVSILRRVAQELKREVRTRRAAGNPPAWGDLWFRSVDSLHALGEAIRCACNHAAHDGSAEFRRSDVGLLLSGTPMLLEHIWELREFLRSPPIDLTLPMV